MKPVAARRIAVSAALLLAVAAYFWLACGVYYDREFNEPHLFPKYRLACRFFFHAPLGESDRDVSSLSASERRAENDYHEFVEVHEGDRHGLPLPF